VGATAIAFAEAKDFFTRAKPRVIFVGAAGGRPRG